MKIKDMIKLSVLLVLVHGALWGDPAGESKEVLWYEDFSNLGESDPTCVKRWRTTASEGEVSVNISHENKLTKFTLTRDGYAPICRILKLPKLSVLEGILFQAKVTSVSNRMMMWSLNKQPSFIIPGEHLGLWTIPVKYKEGVEIPIYFFQAGQIESGYVEMEYVRIVTGLPEKTVVWRREEKEGWEVPIKVGEKVTVIANVGKINAKPTLNFIHSEYNTWRELSLAADASLALNDDGKEGDEVAGDGIWSVQFILDHAAEKSVVAKVSTDEEGGDLYGECPWPLPKK